MTTVNKQSRRRRALAHVDRRVEVWRSAHEGTLTAFPNGFDRDANFERKLDQSIQEQVALTHKLRGVI